MPLRSALFKGDSKLEACLVNDGAHLTLGARGEHVAKVQCAVDALGDKHIDSKELAASYYGPSTAAAVLSYKEKRSIINKSYQQRADNIVGKMTIASLDQDMLQVETSYHAVGCTCRYKHDDVAGRHGRP
jgi:hypothetical protein